MFLRRLSLALNAAAPPPPPFSTVDVDESPAPMDCDELISGTDEEETAVLLAASLALNVEAPNEEDEEDTPAVFEESAPAGIAPDDVDEATKSSVVCRFALI